VVEEVVAAIQHINPEILVVQAVAVDKKITPLQMEGLAHLVKVILAALGLMMLLQAVVVAGVEQALLVWMQYLFHRVVMVALALHQLFLEL
jgi:hypothetical protein